MQIDYFDIEPNEETVYELPWPLNILATHWTGTACRLYYSMPPGATPQQVPFYCIKSEQQLPDTFPGKYFATVHTGAAEGDDDALHLFLTTPVNKPKKPVVVALPTKDPKANGDDDEKTNETNGADNGTD